MHSTKVLVKLLLLSFISEACLANDESEQESKGGSGLETIVVSADLLNKSVDSSALSVEIFDAETLENKAGLATLNDVLETTVNASIVKGTGTAATVRGVDGTGAAQNAVALFTGGRSRLSYEIDNRPVSFNELVYGDISLFDVEKVEVLRGAQSTLVGRNAMAGTVNIQSNKPQYEDEVIFRIAGGNFNTHQLSAVLNKEVIEDAVAFRVSADWIEKESNVEYESYDEVDDPGQFESLNIKAKLLIEPDVENNAKLLIGLTHSDYYGPANEIIVAPYEDRVSSYTNQPRHNPITNTFSVDYSQDIAANVTFELNTSVTDVEFERTTVTDYTNASIDTREYVFEPQFFYDNRYLNAVAGLYYYRGREEEFTEFGASDLHYEDNTDTLSLYSEAAFNVSNEVTLSIGLRYEQESRKRYGGSYSTGVTSDDFNYDQDYSDFLPKVAVNWQQSEAISWGAQISKGYTSGGAGWTLDFSTFELEYYDYKEETSWNYELYARQHFLQDALISAQNVFYSRYKNMQLAYSTTNDWGNDFSYSIVNADKVNTWGIEQSLTAILSEEFTLSGSLGYQQTDIVDFSYDRSLEGNDLTTAPTITSSVSLGWIRDAWQANLNVRYSDSYYTYLENDDSKTEAYFITNIAVSYQLGNVKLFASIDNLFDEDAIIYNRSDSESTASDSAVLLESRSLLAGLEYQF